MGQVRLSLCNRARLSIKGGPSGWEEADWRSWRPRGPASPGTVVTVATAPRTSAALGQHPGPQLQGGCASCCGSAQ